MNFVDQRMGHELGGTFVSPESGNRGDAHVMASTTYTPEVAEEMKRLVRGDTVRGLTPFIPIEEITDSIESESFGESIRQIVDMQVAIKQLISASPTYLVKLYSMAGERGKFDIMNLLPKVVRELKGEGNLSLHDLQLTSYEKGHSCFKVLKQYAASERSVIGPEGGIACQILSALGSCVVKAH